MEGSYTPRAKAPVPRVGGAWTPRRRRRVTGRPLPYLFATSNRILVLSKQPSASQPHQKPLPETTFRPILVLPRQPNVSPRSNDRLQDANIVQTRSRPRARADTPQTLQNKPSTHTLPSHSPSRHLAEQRVVQTNVQSLDRVVCAIIDPFAFFCFSFGVA